VLERLLTKMWTQWQDIS